VRVKEGIFASRCPLEPWRLHEQIIDAFRKCGHTHGVNGLAYGFAYDDVSNQSSTIHTDTPEHMEFGIGW
jgi:hypothetical protein